MTHTPGPWEGGLMVDGGGKRIANVLVYEPEVGAPNHDKRAPYMLDALANARLIAAAPELLEAAKALARWVDGGLNGGVLDGVIVQTRAAINKATGNA